VNRSAEGADEELARQIVSTVLGVPVKRFDYGTAPRQVDALVHYPDRVAALEVVGDHDPKFKRQEEALKRVKHQIEVSGLRTSWTVLLTRKSQNQQGQRSTP
jgi:hypothetical protein